MNARPAVEQPKFVTSAVATNAAPSTPVATDKAAVDKLALALRAGPQAATADAGSPSRALALDADEPQPTRTRTIGRFACARKASSPWPAATSRERGRSSNAPPRPATRAPFSFSATPMIPRRSRAWARSASRATPPGRAITMRAPSRPASPRRAIAWRRARPDRTDGLAPIYRSTRERTSRNGSLVQAALTKSSCRTSPESMKATIPGRKPSGRPL